ncbi:two component system sensor kinase [bacterium endosymbiont of Pedicinus badii]|uniref:two component system sensor kinase n=1 Tax=bacterium endosymbiont of Pedicinus badii TaxID=1719126 RepID=UPI0009BC43DE|nr:two component system sensor kinase [bacterium endosymbiont of Pedicinus badii]OQM34424.1 hypothetical protein AOQ89_00855 [bacterium endosymbiont of Pedicinus badii]
MKITNSIVAKLTTFIILNLIIIWILSIFIFSYISFDRNKRMILENTEKLALLKNNLTSYKFLGAEKDVEELEKKYKNYKEKNHYTSSILEKNDRKNKNVCTYKNTKENYKNFIKYYGTSGQTYYIDSFLFDQKYNILLLPKKVEKGYFFAQKKILNEISEYSKNKKFYWSIPRYQEKIGWIVSVAKKVDCNTVIGLIIKINDIFEYTSKIFGTEINVWTDKKGNLLHFSRVSEFNEKKLKSIIDFKNIREGWQKISGYSIYCKILVPNKWKQITILPNRDFFDESMKILNKQLPFVVLTLLILITNLVILLRIHLAKPLWKFIDIITKTSFKSLQKKLPQNRNDEIGKIAKSYNLLLKILKFQYENLEKQVQYRTRQINFAKKKAEIENKRKSIQITNISHEIRTPLNGILGAIDMLKTTSLSKKQKELNKITKECAVSLSSIVNNLLDYSIIESGQISLHNKITSILRIIDQSIYTIQNASKKKSIELRTFIGRRIPKEIYTDGEKLKQILINILGNAIKFTQKNGKILLSVLRRKKNIRFSIHDNGSGISDKDQSKIFIPFFQSKNTVQGTGLGLTIAKNLVEIMKGKISLYSILNFGTIVVCTIPLLTKEKEEIKFHKEIKKVPLFLYQQLSNWGIKCSISYEKNKYFKKEFQFLPNQLYKYIRNILKEKNFYKFKKKHFLVQPWRMKILIVEDEKINRNLITMMLEYLQQEVYSVSSARKAILLGRVHRFDLVIVDIKMPEISGLSCIEIWREDEKNKDKNCMIVILSASISQKDIKYSKKIGVNQYLIKPINILQIANILSIAYEFQILRNIPLKENHTEKKENFKKFFVPKKKLFLFFKKIISKIYKNRKNKEKISFFLHNIKGIAGQCNLKNTFNRVVKIEKNQKEEISNKEILLLYDTIQKNLKT